MLLGNLRHFLDFLFVLLANFRHKILAIFMCLIISFCGGTRIAAAAAPIESTNEVLDTIIDALSNLTCETQGVGNLIRSEFSHTCIPAPYNTFAIANIVSPGLYANSFLRLHINDDELFPGGCTRGNKIDFNDQKLSFSFCSNILLAAARGGAIANSAVVIARSMLNGSDPWEGVLGSWNIPKSSFHNIYANKKEGDSGIMLDVTIVLLPPLMIPSVLPFTLPWKVIKEKDKMCVATQSFSGWIPVGCKYIKEPYPNSIYADFLGVTPEGSGALENLTSLTTCGNMGSCNKRACQNSRASIVMTGPLIECVREMIAKLMISSSVCSFDDVKNVIGSSSRVTSALFQFQKSMHTTVTALLTIYVIIFGFKIVLAGDAPEKSEVVTFVVKFVFVTYFAVGININPGSGSDLDRMDGMIQWAFPFLLDGMNQLASWVINASPSELCKFSDIYYPETLRHLQLWDSLDCRISHYLGLDALQTMIVDNSTRQQGLLHLDNLSFPIPPYIYLLVPAIISGQFTLIALAIMYPLLIISVAAFIVSATVVCMISIVILGVLAPLFVPMFLFEYTKGYFEAWVKLLISFMLQPMVAVVFMTTMLAVFDFGFYGTCKYAKKDFSYSGPAFTVQDATLDSGASFLSGSRMVRYFYVDQDWSNYTDEEAQGCRDSLGFVLNNPFQFIVNAGTDVFTDDRMPWIEDTTGNEEKKRFEFLDAIKESPGMFFGMLEIAFEKVKKLTIMLLTACLILYLMYHFSQLLTGFMADMTGGVKLDNISIKPQSLYKAGMAATAAVGGIAGSAGDKVVQGGRDLKDKISKLKGEEASDSGGAGDSISTDDGGATDAVSTGADGASAGTGAAGGGAGSASGGAAGGAAGGAGGTAAGAAGGGAAGTAGGGAAGGATAGTVGAVGGSVVPVAGTAAGAAAGTAVGTAGGAAAGGAAGTAAGGAAGGAAGTAAGSAAGGAAGSAAGSAVSQVGKEVAKKVVEQGKEMAKEAVKEVVDTAVDEVKGAAGDALNKVEESADPTAKDDPSKKND
jgi:type IV secretion system protein VirB6